LDESDKRKAEYDAKRIFQFLLQKGRSESKLGKKYPPPLLRGFVAAKKFTRPLRSQIDGFAEISIPQQPCSRLEPLGLNPLRTHSQQKSGWQLESSSWQRRAASVENPLLH